MRRFIEFRPHALSPHARCYALGRYRVHHGTVGLALVAAGAVLNRLPMGSALVGAGAGLIVHDWHDRPWLRDA